MYRDSRIISNTLQLCSAYPVRIGTLHKFYFSLYRLGYGLVSHVYLFIFSQYCAIGQCSHVLYKLNCIEKQIFQWMMTIFFSCFVFFIFATTTTQKQKKKVQTLRTHLTIRWNNKYFNLSMQFNLLSVELSFVVNRVQLHCQLKINFLVKRICQKANRTFYVYWCNKCQCNVNRRFDGLQLIKMWVKCIQQRFGK